MSPKRMRQHLLHGAGQRLLVELRRGVQRMSSARACPSRDLGEEHRQLEREMGEDVVRTCRAGAASAPRCGASSMARGARNPAPRRSSAPRPCRRAGPAAGACAAGRCRRRADHEGGAAAQLPALLLRLLRKGLLQPSARAPAGLHPRAERAGRALRRADGGAEVHQGLREIAGPVRRDQRLRRGADQAAWPSGSGSSTVKSRDITRSTLPSTAAAGRRRRWPRSAAAV